MALIDTHCHLDFPQFEPDRDAVIGRARACGVAAFINIGSSLKGSQDSVALSKRYPDVFASAGIHPHDADGYTRAQYERVALLARDTSVVAIGEVGLDYFKGYSHKENQRAMFSDFLGLAKELSLPVVVHSREAPDDTLAMLKDHGITRAVIHCFSGNEQFLTGVLEAGYFVSFTCNITYKKAHALRELVRITPLERMFLETDAPFLAPETRRGERNEPSGVRVLCEEIAAIKQIDCEGIASRTSAQAKEFFRI